LFENFVVVFFEAVSFYKGVRVGGQEGVGRRVKERVSAAAVAAGETFHLFDGTILLV